MRHRVASLFLLVACLAGQRTIAEDSVSIAELPPLVLKSLQTKHADARLVSATKEERNDYVHYFVKISRDSVARTIEVLENGTIIADRPAK